MKIHASLSILVLAAMCVTTALTVTSADTIQSGQRDSTPIAPSAAKRIDVEAVVNGSLADVWTCWTTNQGVRSFFCQTSNIDVRLGGPYEIMFNAAAPQGERGSEGCTVL